MLRHSKSLLRLGQPRRLPKWHQKQQNLSTSTSSSAAAAVSADELAARESLSALPAGIEYQAVSRNGPGDGIITINVGGKDFKTLRSTVQASPVLCETIAIAEAHGDSTSEKVIFVDRDPTHFPLILTYLRNKVEGISYNDKSVKKTVMGVKKYVFQHTAKHPQYVRLPKDQGALQDLYVEAVHFGLEHLQHQLCHTTFMVTVASWFGGGGNPFLQANEAIKSLRRTFFAIAGASGIMTAMQAELDWAKGMLGIPVGEKSGDDDKSNESGKPPEPTLA